MDYLNLFAAATLGFCLARWLDSEDKRLRISGRKLREMAQYETHRWN